MKGIILAGGSGTRLYPATKAISKHLIPIYNKPMIFYSLSLLMLSEINDILIICNEEDLIAYKNLFGNGEEYGLKICYKIQDEPRGISEAFIIGADFIGKENVALILGDNIFYGRGLRPKLLEARKNVELNSGGIIFGFKVKDPERFGVVEFHENYKVISIDEKPAKPKSNFAITGLYFFDNSCVSKAKNLKPSSRGELEITDLNQLYLNDEQLEVMVLGRGYTWLDAGTPESLIAASQFVQTLEERQGYSVACLEEIAYDNKWIDKKELLRKSELLSKTDYGRYLKSLI